ncbi:MAG: hypothetical protein ABSB79_00890 [Syntrophales bacterium]|jgi:hypothetical protein
MRKIIILPFLITFLVVVISTYSQPSYQFDKKNNATNNHNQESDKPISINSIPNPNHAQQGAPHNECNHIQNVTFEDEIAKYTWYLVVVAFLQFIAILVQIYFFSKTVKATETAANAAKDSADRLLAIERAYIVEGVGLPYGIRPSNSPDDKFSEMKVVIYNRGKTAAMLENISTSVVLTTTTDVSDRGNETNFNHFIGSDDTCEIIVNFYIRANESNMVFAGTNNLFCSGVIDYKDVFEKTYHIDFCWQFHRKTLEMVKVKNIELAKAEDAPLEYNT